MEHTVICTYDQLNRLCMDAFKKFGFSEEEAAIIRDVLLMADMYGIDSHGVQRLVRYQKHIQCGKIEVGVKPEVVFDTPVTAVVDGHHGMGQLTGHFAMKLAIEKAKKMGVGLVTARNSNHYGIAGYYANMAVEEGLIGFSSTNSESLMVPTFGRKAMLGSNPQAWAAPAEPYNFLFDVSTTVVTRGKLEIYNKLGKKIPNGWAVDANGHPTDDAQLVLHNITHGLGGGIMPLGGSTEELGSHKGYGNGMVAELFASILSCGATSNHLGEGGKANTCHGFMAINPAFFGDAAAMKAHMSTLLEELRNSPKAEGQTRIYTHGEKEVEAYKHRQEHGIPVIDMTMLEMYNLCESVGLKFSDYFGDYMPPAAGDYKGSY
ncbi:MAG: Ldh family oxidoreductase [Veillonella sp.]|uniref:Ldh family oxidoreductase n=1 Tax=Veillonella sp. TaxID=1926307 RepID=UPI0025FCA1EB|nr:Ldh family oxidoreductase [Veillonella sp.]MBS4913256.1 Ldh family oxidoreductase [Veillonella sp.]